MARKNRPAGYGMIGLSESQRYFSSTCAPCFCFSFSYSKLRHSNHRIGAHTARIRPYPTGRLFWVALFQALRARLRSCCPSGTRSRRGPRAVANRRLGVHSAIDCQVRASDVRSFWTGDECHHRGDIVHMPIAVECGDSLLRDRPITRGGV
jgi:hypothetical protein